MFWPFSLFKRKTRPIKPEHLTVLRGNGTWVWEAYVEFGDIVILNARATCFGGSGDPQDSGETASGISTKKNPDLAACSLPMDGRQFRGLSQAEHNALDGSPIPRLGAWPVGARETKIVVTEIATGKSITIPVIDLGPGKRTGNAIDLTIAAARQFDPNASATDFEIRCDVRIIGAAKFVKE